MKVRDVMTTDVVSVRTDASFRKIAATLVEHGVGGLPVVDEGQRVVGVVSEADLIVKVQGEAPLRFLRPAFILDRPSRDFVRRAEGTVAGDLMTSPAVTVAEDADLREAARLMSMHGVKRLPVCHKGDLIGILTRADVLKVFTRSDAEIRDEIVSDALDMTLLADEAELDVKVSDGVVTLSGKVETASDARLVERFAVHRDGVVKVINELEVADQGSPRR